MTQCVPLINEAGDVIGNLTRATGRHQAIRKRHRWKWCFNCRKRLPHMLTAFIDDSPWYEPHVYWKCGGCGKDYTRFWGTD